MSALLKIRDGVVIAADDGRVFTPLAEWLATPAETRGRAVLLAADDDPHALADALGGLEAIAVAFTIFKDGRGFSIARILRSRLHWRGELRAVGDIARDQLNYLARCGFDVLALRDDQDADACLAAFNEFSVVYQGAADEPLPLFRRRAEALAALQGGEAP